MANRRRKAKPSENQLPTGDVPGQTPSNPSEPRTNPPPATAPPVDSIETTPPTVPRGDERTAAALPSLSRILSIVMLILGIIAVGALFYKVMAGFFVPLFLAALLVVIFRPVHNWIFRHIGYRARLAALLTTAMILMVVLLPVILVISVAASQFTAMVSQVQFDDLTDALDRGREQLGISLPYAEQFRRLDQLTDSLDESDDPVEVLSNAREAETLVTFLQEKVPGPPAAEAAAAIATEQLQQFQASIEHGTLQPDPASVGQLSVEEEFHRQSVVASASIRSWMRTLLGGTFRSQLRLLANPSAEDFKRLLSRGRETLQPRFVSVTSATGTYLLQILIGLVVLILAVYFFLIDGAGIIRTLMRLSPLDDSYEERLLIEFDRTSRAVVLASVLSALVQGFLAALAFWWFDFDSVILLFLLTSLMALVPFLGAASVWVPCAIYLGAVEERWTAAIILALYGAGVVSSIDNVIKMYVLHGRSTLHPLFALLSVLGGVKVFGPIGILVGPMVVVFLQTLLEILNHELAGKQASEVTPDEPSL